MKHPINPTWYSTLALLMLATAGCSRPTPSAITNTRLLIDAEAPGQAAEPLELRKVELEPGSDDDAGPRDWVVCDGGVIMVGDQRVDVCRGDGRAWVDPELDEVTLNIDASNAVLVRAKVGKAVFEAPVIQGRARMKVSLRPAIAELEATRLATENTLIVALEIEHDDGVARGEVGLRSPRAMGLMASVAKGAVRFEDEVDKGTTRDHVLVVGPEPDLYPKGPAVALHQVDVVVVDDGEPITVPPCPLGETRPTAIVSAFRAGRTVRPPRLTAYDRRSGEKLGQHTFRLDVPPCPAEVRGQDPVTVHVMAETVAHLVAGRAVPLPTAPSRLDLSDVPLGDPNVLLKFKTFFGLSATSTEADVVAKLGAARLPETTQTREAKLIALSASHSVGALIDATTGKLVEIWIDDTSGVFDLDLIPLMAKNLDPRDIALVDLVDRVVLYALKLLGRPTRPAASSDGFYVWTVDEAGLTVFVELHCNASPPFLCNRMHVGWLTGADPHDGGDVPGARHTHDSHRDPVQPEPTHDHDHDHGDVTAPPRDHLEDAP
jgi:hypothetical protein